MRLALRLEGGDLDLVRERRVIKADEVTALRDARRIVEDAQGEAERIIGSANAAFEAERQRGYDEGLQAGNDKVGETLVELVSDNARLVSGLEAQVPEIVMSALRQILGSFDDFDLALGSVKQALKMFHKETEVTVRVAPTQFADMRSRMAELRAENSVVSYVDVVADRDLAPGDCVIETELGSVNAGIEQQLAVIERAMRNELAPEGDVRLRARG